MKLKINYRNTILVGLAFMTICAFWELYDFIVPLILRNTFKLSESVNGFIMAADNVAALIMLPLFGMLSDKTHTKFGRRIPFIVFGTIAAGASMLLIPFTAHAQQLTYFIIALGFVLLFMSVYRSPAVALMPDITPKPLRSKGNAIINLMGAVGGALILLLNAFLAPDTKNPETANYWPIFISVVGIMFIGMLILIKTINEPKLVKKMRKDSASAGIDVEEAKKDISKSVSKEKLPKAFRLSMLMILVSIFLWFMGYNAVTTAFSRYATNYLDMEESVASIIKMVAIVAATISFIPVGIISSKIGRKKSILFGVILLAATFGTATFYTSYTPLLYVTFALCGIAWACINVNSLPMVLEMSKGANVGRYTGYYYTFSMAAQVVTPILSGFLLEYVGYYTLLPYGAAFVGLAFITMLLVKHGDSKDIVIPDSKIEVYNAAD